MTAAQYREEHQIPPGVRIESDDVKARREKAAAENWEDERYRTSQELTRETHWQRKLASAGWSTWAEVVAWRDEHDASWQEVADHLDIEEVLTTTQEEHLETTINWVAAHGSVLGIKPQATAGWLGNVRRRARRGQTSFIIMALDHAVPGWNDTGYASIYNPCYVAGCENPQARARRCEEHQDVELSTSEVLDATEARFQVVLRNAGWESLHDARAWAEETGHNWDDVAAHLHVTPGEVRSRAKAAGVKTPFLLSPREQRMIGLVRTRAAAAIPRGALPVKDSSDLSTFLAHQRNKAEAGERTRIHEILDSIDQLWPVPLHKRPRAACAATGCVQPTMQTSNYCARHHEQHRDATQRSVGTGAATVTCRECGLAFQLLGRHLITTHGLSVEEYQSRYPGASVNPRTKDAQTRGEVLPDD